MRSAFFGVSTINPCQPVDELYERCFRVTRVNSDGKKCLWLKLPTRGTVGDSKQEGACRVVPVTENCDRFVTDPGLSPAFMVYLTNIRLYQQTIGTSTDVK